LETTFLRELLILDGLELGKVGQKLLLPERLTRGKGSPLVRLLAMSERCVDASPYVVRQYP
jgi:hypothetical protein